MLPLSNRHSRFVLNYLLPGVELLVMFLQLSACNGYFVPESITLPLEMLTDHITMLFEFPEEKEDSLAVIS